MFDSPDMLKAKARFSDEDRARLKQLITNMFCCEECTAPMVDFWNALVAIDSSVHEDKKKEMVELAWNAAMSREDEFLSNLTSMVMAMLALEIDAFNKRTGRDLLEESSQRQVERKAKVKEILGMLFDKKF